MPQDSVVYCAPEFNVYPLVFYVGDRCYFGALLDAESPLAEVAGSLKSPLRAERCFPDWIVAFGATLEAKEKIEFRPRVLKIKMMN